MDESINVESKKQSRRKPPLSPVRITGEISAGIATGAAAAAIVYSSLYGVAYGAEIAGLGEGCMGGLALWVIVAIMCLVVPLTYGLASVVGVYLVGSGGTQMGLFLATLGFGLIGGFVMLVMLVPVALLSPALIVGVENIVRWTLWVLVSLIPPIFATLSFNLTRRYKYPSPT